MGLLRGVLLVFSNARRQLVIRSRQIRTDPFPVITSISCLPQRVAGEEQQTRIEWRKDDRLGPQHREIFCLHRHWKYVLGLTRAAIESRQFAANDDVRIEGISADITNFLGRIRLPVAKRDLAFVAAAFDSNPTALLLSTLKATRKRVVSAAMIQLRG